MTSGGTGNENTETAGATEVVTRSFSRLDPSQALQRAINDDYNKPANANFSPVPNSVVDAIRASLADRPGATSLVANIDPDAHLTEEQRTHRERKRIQDEVYRDRRLEFQLADKLAKNFGLDAPRSSNAFTVRFPGCGTTDSLCERAISLSARIHAGDTCEDILSFQDKKPARRGLSTKARSKQDKTATAKGMRIGGTYASVVEMGWGEANYDVFTSHPALKANSWPLVTDQRSAELYRFPPHIMQYCGPVVNVSASLDYIDVLRAMDRCVPFDSCPVDPLTKKVFVDAVSSDQGAHKASGSQLILTEFHNTPSAPMNRRYGEFRRYNISNDIVSPVFQDAIDTSVRLMKEADEAKGGEVLSEQQYIQKAKSNYNYDMKANLISDYRDFWPSFPYVCKTKPNYYFENLRPFLEDVHPIWGLYGNDCLVQGWNAFPQTITDPRKPLGWYGYSISQPTKALQPDADNIDNYVPMRPSKLKNIRILPYSFPSWWWTVFQSDKNIALCLGRMTHNVIAFDIDVSKRNVVGKIIKVLEETVGISPFIRVGNYPKVMLLYRLPEGVKLTSMSIPLGDDLGMIEILSEGKTITAFGIHHSLRTTFQWIGGKNPAQNSPKEAPVVTLGDIEDFLVEVSTRIAPIPAKYLPKTTTESGQRVVRGRVLVSDRAAHESNYSFTEDGLICDGRSDYVRRVAFMSVARHKADIAERGFAACVDQCVADAAETLRETMLLDGGRWQVETIESLLRRDIENMGEKLNNGDADFAELLSSDMKITKDGVLRADGHAGYSRHTRNSRSLFLLGRYRTNETADVSFRTVTGGDAELESNVRVRPASYNTLDANGRNVAYPDDGVREGIAQDLGSHLSRFIRAVYNGEEETEQITANTGRVNAATLEADLLDDETRTVTHVQTQEQKEAEAEAVRSSIFVIDVPTGSGKTSRLIERIVNDPRTIEPQVWYDEKDTARERPKLVNRPFVIAMPNYNNIEEAVARARILCMKKGMDDATLISELLRQECVTDEADARNRLPEIRQMIESSTRDESLPIPKIQVYRGREKSNCAFTFELKQLAAAHQPADRLCAATVRDETTKEDKEVFCEHYATCAYIKQKEEIKDANIIFLVHSFLGNNALPETIKQARALVIDEQIHQQFMHTQFMEREQFDISPEIFNIWDMDYADTPEKVKKYKAHNDYMYAQREAIPMRDWLIDLVIATARDKKDPAAAIMASKQRFNIEKWRAQERPDYDAAENDDQDAPRAPVEIAAIGPILSEEEKQSALKSARQRARTLYANFVEEVEYDEQGNAIEKEGFLSPRRALHNAVAFLSSLFKQDVRIEPGMSNNRIRAKLSQPGLINAEAEREMWRAIQERIAILEHDNAMIAHEKEYERSLFQFATDFGVERGTPEFEAFVDGHPQFALYAERAEKALALYRHEHKLRIPNRNLIDPRFQFVLRRKDNGAGIEMVPMLRFSWRTHPGWNDTPVMLMDASADKRIIQKIFAPRPVEVYTTREDKGRILNMELVVVTDHLYSNNSLIGSKDASIVQKMKAARNLANVRDAISMVCANHAGSRVVFGAPKNVRQAILTAWEDKPEQVDSCHFGAMRGIDAYKKHMALLCIGRMEPPVEDIDAMAACFSYDDEVYEQPFNINGNGCEDEEGERPLYQEKYPRMIHMRERQTDRGVKKEVATFMTAMVKGQWGRIVQSQCREEEINQLVGRLRPVYRTPETRPTCYILSSSIPEHLIVDDVVSLYDLIGTDGRTNTRPVSKAVEASPLPPVIAKERLFKWYLTNVLRIATRFDAMLCPHEIVDQAGHLLPSELRSVEAVKNLLRTFHFQEDKIINERGEIASRASLPAISDGWYGVEIDNPTVDGACEVWTPISNYENTEEANARIEGRYGWPVSRVLHVPQKIVCYDRAQDSVELQADTGQTEESEVDESTSTLLAIRDAVEKMMVNDIVEIVGGREVKTTALVPTCFEGQTLSSDVALYNMSNPLLDAIMQVGPSVSPEVMAKIAEMQARVRYVKMTYEQIMAFMSIQQVWGDTAQDIAARVSSATMSADGVPTAYLSIRSKFAELESESASAPTDQDKKADAVFASMQAVASVTLAAPKTDAARPRRRTTNSATFDQEAACMEDAHA